MVSYRHSFPQSLRLILPISLFILSPAVLSAQEEKKEKDKTYVEKIKSLFSIKPYTNQNIDLLMVNYNKSTEDALWYRPASGINFGGEVAFAFLHFNYQKNLPLFQPDLPDGFKASQQRFGFDAGGKIFGVMMTYQQSNGFYVYNQAMIPDSGYSNREQVIFRNDLISKTFGLDLRLTLSNKLSANAIFVQSERQLKSKGAISFIFGNRFNDFHGSSPFVPPHLQSFYPESATVKEIWTNTIHIMPGYSYIAVAGYWNFGLSLYSGTGLQIRKYFTTTDEDKLALKIPFLTRGKAGVSYNGKFFFTKFAVNFDFTTLGMKDANFRWMQSYWEYSLGLRLYGKKKK